MIGGLVASTFITLLVIPVIYTYLAPKRAVNTFLNLFTIASYIENATYFVLPLVKEFIEWNNGMSKIPTLARMED